jgi:hypothetical protein
VRSRILSARSLAALAVCGALAAGCSSTKVKSGLGLWQPGSVAVFNGYTLKNAGLHPYVAVANTGRDEVVLVDAVDDAPVPAPILFRPLAIVVGQPRPTEVLAASLGDATATAPLADLLVVRSAGSSVLQVVKTWVLGGEAADPRVLPALDVDLAAGATDAEVLAMVAAPVPLSDGVGGFTAAPGRVRVVAALSGQRLSVVEFTRQPDGSITPGAAVVQELSLPVGGAAARFDAVSLAVNPALPQLVYAATLDPIPTAAGTVEGVAELDASLAPGAWTWRGLDARAPTRLVAAWTLRERLANSAADGVDALEATARDRVYAYLDPTRCGATQRVGCGIAVIDPASGQLAADPAAAMPYMAPIAVPAVPVALVVSAPPVKPPSQSAEESVFAAPYMRISPGSGVRLTTAVLEVPATDGHVYFVDLARWAIPNDGSILRLASTRTAVTSAVAGVADEQRIGLWDVTPLSASPPSAAVLQLTGTPLRDAIAVVPGYTPSDTWTATWQGVLPGLATRSGETGPVGDGRPWLALQVHTADSSGTVRPTQIVRVYDPTLGIHVGDLADVATSGLSGCPGVLEARIAALGAPDAARPGGHLVLDELACVPPSSATGTEDCTARDEFRACAPALAAGQARLPVTLYAGDLVVSSDGLGYAGRAPLVTPEQLAASPDAPELEYRLDYLSPDGLDEDALAALCPLVPWPWADPFPASPPSVTCDDACRARCEQLVLARKARRIYHVSDRCGDLVTDATCHQLWPDLPFPQANGPALLTRFGLRQKATTPDAPITRGLGVVFATRSGITPASRYPSTTATPTLPAGAAVFDRSAIAGKEEDGYRVFVPYADGHVLDFSPSLGSNTPVVIR